MPCTRRELNPQPLCYEACALPLCYNRCPTKVLVLKAKSKIHHLVKVLKVLKVRDQFPEVQKGQVVAEALAEREDQPRQRDGFLEGNRTHLGQMDADPDDLQVCVGGRGQELRHGGDREVLAVGAREVKAVDQTVIEITQLEVASS